MAGLQEECAGLKAELHTQRAAHGRALDGIRTDAAALLREHDAVSAQLADARRAAAADAETRARVDEEREGIVRDLMALVQEQRCKLKRGQVRPRRPCSEVGVWVCTGCGMHDRLDVACGVLC